MALTLNGTTGISGIAGSAGTPALQGNNDANTGYFFGTDTLGLSTAGTQRLHINATGYLGINDSSGNARLVIKGDSDVSDADCQLRIYDTDSTAGSQIPSIAFFGGNTEIGRIRGTDTGGMRFYTANSGTLGERLRITSAGKIGIGTTSPARELHLVTTGNNAIRIEGGASHTCQLLFTPASGTEHQGRIGYYHGDDCMDFYTAANERMRIDSSGRLLITSITSRSIWGANPQLQIEKLDSNAALTIIRNQNNAGGPWLALCKSRGTSNGAVTIVQDGDSLGSINWFGADGVDLASTSAEIRAEIDGTPGENDLPGRIIFKTTADGASSATERLRIDAAGNLTAVNTASGGQSVTLKLGASHASGTNDGIIRIVNGGTGNGVIQWDYENAANRAQIYVYRSTQDLIFTTAGSERMRLTNGDTIAMGATSYGGGGANPRLYLKSNSGRQLKIHNPDAGTVGLQLTNSGSGEGEDAGLFIAMLSGGGGYIKSNVNNADFMDWYSQVSGSQKHILKVYNDGKHGLQSNTDCLMLSTNQDGTGNNYFLRGSKNSTTPGGGNDVAWIYEDGDMYNSNGTFSQGSDVALKENIVDANSQWADIKGLKFRNFNFKASTGLDTHKQLGLVAQEVEPISPGLIKDRDKIVKTINSDGTVTETIDGTTKSIKLSILYMKGMKALQEAMSRIETLEAKVTSLESA